MDEALFKHRVPEAAARQLAVVLAWATECNLATLERLEERKTSSAYDKNRQKSICDTLVRHCRELNVAPSGLDGRHCGRLADEYAALDAAAKEARNG